MNVADRAGGQAARLAIELAAVEQLGVETVQDPGVDLLQANTAGGDHVRLEIAAVGVERRCLDRGADRR